MIKSFDNIGYNGFNNETEVFSDEQLSGKVNQYALLSSIFDYDLEADGDFISLGVLKPLRKNSKDFIRCKINIDELTKERASRSRSIYIDVLDKINKSGNKFSEAQIVIGEFNNFLFLTNEKFGKKMNIYLEIEDSKDYNPERRNQISKTNRAVSAIDDATSRQDSRFSEEINLNPITKYCFGINNNLDVQVGLYGNKFVYNLFEKEYSIINDLIPDHNAIKQNEENLLKMVDYLNRTNVVGKTVDYIADVIDSELIRFENNINSSALFPEKERDNHTSGLYVLRFCYDDASKDKMDKVDEYIRDFIGAEEQFRVVYEGYRPNKENADAKPEKKIFVNILLCKK